MSTKFITPQVSKSEVTDVEGDNEKGIARGQSSHSTTSLDLHSGVEEFEDGEIIIGNGEKNNEENPTNIVQRILSRRSMAISNHNAEPPPDGGTKAWLQVLAGHLCVFNVMGYASSYGLFEAYYLSPVSPFPTLTSSAWAWPGSVQICFFFLLGTVSGRLFDAGYYRPTVIFGLSLQVLGAFTASVSKNYVQIFLSQGLCHGIGSGLVLCPTVGLLSTYFSKRRSLAIALAAGGSGTGGVVFPLISQQLMGKIGFVWTVRIMGFVMLANAAIILSLARTRIRGRNSGPWLELAAFKEWPYVLFICGMFSVFLGLYFVFIYVNLYAKNVLGTSTHISFTVLMVLNGIGLPGRVFPAFLADAYFGPVNTLIPCVFLLAILFFVWISITSLSSLYAFVVLLGFIDASVQGIFMSGIASLTEDLSKVGTRVGMALSILSCASLCGPPIAGKLIDMNGGSFLYTQIFGGSVTFAGLALLTACRISKTGCSFQTRM